MAAQLDTSGLSAADAAAFNSLVAPAQGQPITQPSTTAQLDLRGLPPDVAAAFGSLANSTASSAPPGQSGSESPGLPAPGWYNAVAGAVPMLGTGLHLGSQLGASAVAGVRSLADLARGVPLAQIDQANQRYIAANTYNPPAGSFSDLTNRAMASPSNPLNWVGKGFDALGQSINNATDPRTWAQRLDTPSGNPLLADKAGTVGYGPPSTALPTMGTGSTALGPIVSGALQVATGVKPIVSGVRTALTRPVAALPGMGSPQSIGAAVADPQLSGASPELQQAVTQAARKTGGAVNTDAMSRHLEADSLPVKVQLTAGQATQDPIAISQEMNMRARFPQLADRLNQQNGQLIENVRTIRDAVGPDVFSTNPVEHGDTLIAAYKAKDAAAQADISAKYQALRDANGGQFPVDPKALLDNASAQLHQRLLFDDAPKPIMATLNRLANSGTMTFENFEALRTNLARIQRSLTADGNEKAAAGVIRGAMEQLPLSAPTGTVKTLADTARAAAKAQFDALEADPAYKAAVNDTVPPDRFVGRFIINAPRDDVAQMARNLAQNPGATQTMAVAALDHLRGSAGIAPDWTGNFSAPRFNKALQALDPKLGSLFDRKTADQLETLGNVARYTQSQPRGSFVNNSNTLVGALGNYGAGALEGAVNVAAHGIPVGTWGRKVATHYMGGRTVKQAVQPGAGLLSPPPPRGGLMGIP